ncbi:MAG: hypothetical protein GY856_28735 [bacterium]|nr:hypothetical protein [bacterium]
MPAVRILAAGGGTEIVEFKKVDGATASCRRGPVRLHVTDSDASRLRVYGTTAYALLGSIDLCCNPGTSPVARACLRSPRLLDRGLVDRIQVVDLATWQELAEIPLADQPWAMTINPCGRRSSAHNRAGLRLT